MALSFGRKKGEAANEADATTADVTNADAINGVSNATPAAAPAPARQPNAKAANSANAEEGVDESWFDTLAEEAAANPLPPAAPPPNFSVPSATPEPDFSVFSTEEPEDFGDFGKQVDIPAASGAFVAPASNVNAPPASNATPFDGKIADSPATTSAKKDGGLKKMLPILLVLLIVGGGGYFWYAQQSGQGDGDEIRPQPTKVMPTSSAPTSAAPTGSATSVAPATAPPSAQDDPATKAQLKKLWNEGLMLRKQNKNAAAKAKWGAAVRLARSKPGHEKSADMIQQAIDKVK